MKGASVSGVSRVHCHVRFMWGRMETPKKQRGRPRKKPDTIPFWRFARGAMAVWAYDEARARDEKHSAAVQYAVDFVRQRHPEMPISATEVKRILATWRPRGAESILRFEPKTLTEEDIEKRRSILKLLGVFPKRTGAQLEVPRNDELAKGGITLTIRFAERPDYPRHNRKIPKE